jgi:glycosyltransferase involved in cell wall biosynthesis
MGSISVFFPTFNDERSICSLVAETCALLPTLTDDYEVIVVNDGSTDGTGTVLDELACTLPHLKVIHHAANKGYGAALRTGFSQASKDLVFYTDGDGQYDVRELAALPPLMTEAVHVVNGYKIKRADGRHRVLLGAIYNRLARWLFQLPIRDVDCDFRLMRRHAIQQIELASASGAICVEMVFKLHAAGYTFIEVPVHHYPRVHGRSRFFTPRRVARTAVDFLALWVKLVVLPPRAFSASRRVRAAAENGAAPDKANTLPD